MTALDCRKPRQKARPTTCIEALNLCPVCARALAEALDGVGTQPRHSSRADLVSILITVALPPLGLVAAVIWGMVLGTFV